MVKVQDERLHVVDRQVPEHKNENDELYDMNLRWSPFARWSDAFRGAHHSEQMLLLMLSTVYISTRSYVVLLYCDFYYYNIFVLQQSG